MRKVLLVGLMVAAVAGVARAEDKAMAPKAAKPKAAKVMSVSGTVEAVDAAGMKLTVKDKKGVATEFMLTADAKVKKGGKAATLADVMVGDMATVKYTMNMDQKVVKSVDAKAPKAAKAAAKK